MFSSIADWVTTTIYIYVDKSLGTNIDLKMVQLSTLCIPKNTILLFLRFQYLFNVSFKTKVSPYLLVF